MLTVAFAERLKAAGISVNACHPGDVNSQLSNDLGFGGHESPEQGARTPVWLATHDIGIEKTGKYFSHQREERCRFGEDLEAVERLYEICSGYG
jgi:NAD(P)-dependent dehydrogenase (short-subunit alcohol dehydrogenase family)